MELFSFRCFTFQSTLPARGATSADHMAQAPDCISIHAPRTGSDGQGRKPQPSPHISIHAPRTGSDPKTSEKGERLGNFNPRSPHGERLDGII